MIIRKVSNWFSGNIINILYNLFVLVRMHGVVDGKNRNVRIAVVVYITII